MRLGQTYDPFLHIHLLTIGECERGLVYGNHFYSQFGEVLKELKPRALTYIWTTPRYQKLGPRASEQSQATEEGEV